MFTSSLHAVPLAYSAAVSEVPVAECCTVRMSPAAWSAGQPVACSLSKKSALGGAGGGDGGGAGGGGLGGGGDGGGLGGGLGGGGDGGGGAGGGLGGGGDGGGGDGVQSEMMLAAHVPLLRSRKEQPAGPS